MPIAPLARRIALLLVLAVSVPVVARADDASHRAKATEMMNLLHIQHNIQQISENIKKQVSDNAEKIGGAAPTDQQKAKIAEVEKKANQLIDSQLSWETLQTAFTDIYVKNFTEAQLDNPFVFLFLPVTHLFSYFCGESIYEA